jgi:hypothetical protein
MDPLATPDCVGTADPVRCISRNFGAAFARPTRVAEKMDARVKPAHDEFRGAGGP